LQILERPRQLLERVALRDELVDLEPPAEVEVGEERKIAARSRRAVAAAEDRLVLVEGVDDELEARAELRDADDGERAAGPERLERLLDDGEAADGLERVVGAAARQVLDRRDGIVARGVDRVRRAEPAREGELLGHDVDGDDPGRTRENAALDAAETDAAQAEDRHRRAGLDLRPVHDRADARHDPAADERRADDRRRIGNRAVDHAQVRVAEPRRLDRDADLAGARVLDAHVLDRNRPPAAMIDRGAHHAGLPTWSTRPGRTPVSSPSSTIVSPLTMTRTTPSGRTCQRSSPPGMARTSAFLPSPSRAGSKSRTS